MGETIEVSLCVSTFSGEAVARDLSAKSKKLVREIVVSVVEEARASVYNVVASVLVMKNVSEVMVRRE